MYSHKQTHEILGSTGKDDPERTVEKPISLFSFDIYVMTQMTSRHKRHAHKNNYFNEIHRDMENISVA